MTGLLDRELYPNNLLDRVQNLERRLKDLERLAGRPGTEPGQLAYYQADGSLYLGSVPALAFQGAVGMLQMFPALVGLWPGGGLGVSTTSLFGAQDYGGLGLHLTRNGGAHISHLNPPAPHYFFDGINSYYSLADTGAVKVLGTEAGVRATLRGLTVGGWFYFDSAIPAALEVPIGKLSAAAGNFSYWLRHLASTGVVDTAISGDGSAAIGSGGDFTPGAATWVFVAGRYRPSTYLQTWINGTLNGENTTSIPASIFNSNAAFTIGGDSGGGRLMAGRAALCFLCAAAVPDTWIQSFYQYSKALFGA